MSKLWFAAPLARVIVLTGPWCEGEIRATRAASGVVRIRWHEWQLRLPAELIAPDSGSRQNQGCVAIRTQSLARYSMLADVCAALGWQSTPAPVSKPGTASNHDLLLIDGWENLPLASTAGDSIPRVLFLSFPRPDDLQLATERGIFAVIALPCLLPGLATALTVAVPQADRRAIHQSVA